MSTNLKSPLSNLTATRFVAAKGTSIQLTMPKARFAGDRRDQSIDVFKSMQFTRGEALLVAHTLLAFAAGLEEEE